jgi:hypothetical protein
MTTCQFLIGLTWMWMWMWTFINFMDEFWTEVPSLFLAISKVPSTIQIETEMSKNKVIKPQRDNVHLTLLLY